MSKLQGYIKPLKSTTLRIWRNGRDEIELAWDGNDLLLYRNGNFLRKVTDSISVEIEVWDPTKSYIAGDVFVSYKSPDFEFLSEDDPLRYEYIYRCIENTSPGESPETHPDKWERQGKVSEQNDNTIFIPDISGLEERLNELVKYTDFSDEFTIDNNNTVSLNIDYITLSDFSGKDYIQPDPLPPANIRLSSTSVNVTEGDSTIITVVLDREPTDDVVLSVISQDTNIATVVPGSITFTTANYDTPQNIQINGVSDANSVTDSTTITVAVSSSNDPNYTNLTPKYISVNVADLDNADYILSKSNMSITEGTSDTFNVRLATEPISNVNISVSSSDTNIATVDRNSLTFTPLNYNTNQTVTVNAVENTDIGDKNTTIVLKPSSTDPSYGNLPNKSVAITSIDNDALAPNEIRINNTIWKTKNETWDDGGDGIIPAIDSDGNDVSYIYGKLYTVDAVQRLLAANSGYRVPTYDDFYDINNRDIVGGFLISGPIEHSAVLFDFSEWSPSAFNNELGLGFIASGYAYVDSANNIIEHGAVLNLVKLDRTYYSTVRHSLIGQAYHGSIVGPNTMGVIHAAFAGSKAGRNYIYEYGIIEYILPFTEGGSTFKKLALPLRLVKDI